RQREAISLEQAHAALELFAVRDRVGASGKIDTADLEVAREAYGALGRGFDAAPVLADSATPRAITPPGATVAGATREGPAVPSGIAPSSSAAASGALGAAAFGVPEEAPQIAPPKHGP